MSNKIIIKDISLATKLKQNIYKNSDYKNNGSLTVFTQDELDKITKLKLENQAFMNLSGLSHCRNLKELEIISKNYKDFDTSSRFHIPREIVDQYKMETIHADDFSFIHDLKKLESLHIENCSKLEELNLSGLDKLQDLSIIGNRNLRKIEGIDELHSLAFLKMLKNGQTLEIDLEKLINEGNLIDAKLDIDMFSNINEKCNNLVEKNSKWNNNGISVKWIENISDFRENVFNTVEMSQMNKKIDEVLNDIIKPWHNDIEKVASIYNYITKNVTYDYDGLSASRGNSLTKDSMFIREKNIPIDKIIDRKQSSYGAIIYGTSVCEGYTHLMHSMLNKVDITSFPCTCNALSSENRPSGRNSNHAIIRVNINDKWLYFDPTNDTNKKEWEYFGLSKESITKIHALSLLEADIKGNSSIDIKDHMNYKINSEKEVLNTKELKKTLDFLSKHSIILKNRHDDSSLKTKDEFRNDYRNNKQELKYEYNNKLISPVQYKILSYELDSAYEKMNAEITRTNYREKALTQERLNYIEKKLGIIIQFDKIYSDGKNLYSYPKTEKELIFEKKKSLDEINKYFDKIKENRTFSERYDSTDSMSKYNLVKMVTEEYDKLIKNAIENDYQFSSPDNYKTSENELDDLISSIFNDDYIKNDKFKEGNIETRSDDFER